MCASSTRPALQRCARALTLRTVVVRALTLCSAQNHRVTDDVDVGTGVDDRLTDLNRAAQSGVPHASSSPSLSANMYNIPLQSEAIHQYVNTISTISDPTPSTIRTPTSHPSLPRRVIPSTTCDTISLMSNPPPASSRHMEAMMAARCAWNSRSSSKPSSSNARNTPSLFLGPDAPASSHSPAHPALPASSRTRFAPT